MKKASDKIDIAHVAKLANLKLTPTEEKTFGKQLGDVLTYIDQLNEVNTDKVEPIGHITGTKNVYREDQAAPSFSQEDSLKNAHKTHNGFIQVDAIFQEQDQ